MDATAHGVGRAHHVMPAGGGNRVAAQGADRLQLPRQIAVATQQVAGMPQPTLAVEDHGDGFRLRGARLVMGDGREDAGHAEPAHVRNLQVLT